MGVSVEEFCFFRPARQDFVCFCQGCKPWVKPRNRETPRIPDPAPACLAAAKEGDEEDFIEEAHSAREPCGLAVA